MERRFKIRTPLMGLVVNLPMVMMVRALSIPVAELSVSCNCVMTIPTTSPCRKRLSINIRIATEGDLAGRATREPDHRVNPYYRYPLLRLDLTFGSCCNSAPISLDCCKHTLVVSTYMFRVFFPAENDAEER